MLTLQKVHSLFLYKALNLIEQVWQVLWLQLPKAQYWTGSAQMKQIWSPSPSPSSSPASKVAFADAAAASADKLAAAKWPDRGTDSFGDWGEGRERCGGRCLPLPRFAELELLRGAREGGGGCEVELEDEGGGGTLLFEVGGVAVVGLLSVSCPEKAALRDILK